MGTMIEFHILNSLPLNCVNRGEDGEIKTVMYGGVVRQRVSSQAWKRSMREYIQGNSTNKGISSKCWTSKSPGARCWASKVEAELITRGVSIETAKKKVDKLFKLAEKDNVMMYLSHEEFTAVVEGLCTGDDSLYNIIKGAQARISEDISAFGRMFADNKDMNVEGAVRVAHAISTHEIEQETDYFTAFDDISNADGETGAGHLGALAYTSSVLYRHIAMDVDLYFNNLMVTLSAEEKALSLEKVIKAIVDTFPKGKQNSMLAESRPHYVMMVVKSIKMPDSLAVAFESPVKAKKDGLLNPSIDAIRKGVNDLESMYGEDLGIIEKTEAYLGNNTNRSQAIKSIIDAAISRL